MQLTSDISTAVHIMFSYLAFNEHSDSRKTCPVTGKTHDWRPARKGDSRSPCPALNTMANHGYIPRDGKNISPWDLAAGLKACYNLSTLLAFFLSFVGFLILRRIRNVDLHEIGEHGRIEHDASLVHKDTPKGRKYAPIRVHSGLVKLLLADAKTGDEEGEGPEYGDRRILMDAIDVARARVRREKESPELDRVHAEIARGEMGIILGVMETHAGKNVGVPVEWLREWMSYERLPTGWKPSHVQGLFDVVSRSKAIRTAMTEFREKEVVEKS